MVLAVVWLTGCGSDRPATVTPPTDLGKVTVAGDSISVGLGAELRAAVDDGVEVVVIGQGGTGLARPDVFDWPARLRELAHEFPPDVLVFSVGSNDGQDLTDAAGNTVVTMAEEADWDAEYRRRLAEVFDAFGGTGTEVVWVGHIRTPDRRTGETNRRIHRLAVEEAAVRDWVRVEDLAELVGSGDTTARDCLLDDGVHLSVGCYRRAADRLAGRLGI
jgi:lysophospholipase L1-like esterase